MWLLGYQPNHVLICGSARLSANNAIAVPTLTECVVKGAAGAVKPHRQSQEGQNQIYAGLQMPLGRRYQSEHPCWQAPRKGPQQQWESHGKSLRCRQWN